MYKTIGQFRTYVHLKVFIFWLAYYQSYPQYDAKPMLSVNMIKHLHSQMRKARKILQDSGQIWYPVVCPSLTA